MTAYDSKLNTFICSRCGLQGLPSIWKIAGFEELCSACANHLRFRDVDPLNVIALIRQHQEPYEHWNKVRLVKIK